MNPRGEAEELALLGEMRQRYAAIPWPAPPAAWRPGKSLWRRLKPLLARSAGAVVRQRKVGDHVLRYWETGPADAPPVVLLHGFAAGKENWGALLPLLGREYRLLVPDLPGFGESGFAADADYRLEAQSDRVAAWLAEEGVQRAHLVGSSMGGAIAALLSARHPERVASLCLMNAAGVPGERLSTLEARLAEGKNLLIPGSRRAARLMFTVVLHPRRRLLAWWLGQLMAGELRQRAAIHHHLFGGLVDSLPDVYRCLKSIDAPALILWGEGDQVVDVSCGAVFAQRLPRSELQSWPDVGHLPMLEAPARTARALRGFWGRCDASARVGETA